MCIVSAFSFCFVLCGPLDLTCIAGCCVSSVACGCCFPISVKLLEHTHTHSHTTLFSILSHWTIINTQFNNNCKCNSMNTTGSGSIVLRCHLDLRYGQCPSYKVKVLFIGALLRFRPPLLCVVKCSYKAEQMIPSWVLM